MHPVIDGAFARQRLRLRDFIFMMDRNMIHAAGMNVKAVSKIFARHGGAFDVPAGIAHSPGARPLHDMFFRRFLPKRKIGGMTFFRVHLYAFAGACKLLFQIRARQAAVMRKF